MGNTDNIKHPKHYTKIKNMETVEIIEALVDQAVEESGYSGSEAYHFATVLKYCLRSPFKNPTKKGMAHDLRKMCWHSERLINLLEEDSYLTDLGNYENENLVEKVGLTD